MDVAGSLDHISKQGGLIGTIMVVSWLALGVAIKALWNDNRDLRKDLKDLTISSTTAINKFVEQAAISSEQLRTLVALVLNGKSGKE
jgi:hypothetical protein